MGGRRDRIFGRRQQSCDSVHSQAPSDAGQCQAAAGDALRAECYQQGQFGYTGQNNRCQETSSDVARQGNIQESGYQSQYNGTQYHEAVGHPNYAQQRFLGRLFPRIVGSRIQQMAEAGEEEAMSRIVSGIQEKMKSNPLARVLPLNTDPNNLTIDGERPRSIAQGIALIGAAPRRRGGGRGAAMAEGDALRHRLHSEYENGTLAIGVHNPEGSKTYKLADRKQEVPTPLGGKVEADVTNVQLHVAQDLNLIVGLNKTKIGGEGLTLTADVKVPIPDLSSFRDLSSLSKVMPAAIAGMIRMGDKKAANVDKNHKEQAYETIQVKSHIREVNPVTKDGKQCVQLVFDAKSKLGGLTECTIPLDQISPHHQQASETRLVEARQHQQQPSETRLVEARKPEPGHWSNYTTKDNCKVQYFCKGDSKTPDTVYVGDNTAWVADEDGRTTHKFNKVGDKWSPEGRWDGTIAADPTTGELIVKPNNGEPSSRWEAAQKPEEKRSNPTVADNGKTQHVKSDDKQHVIAKDGGERAFKASEYPASKYDEACKEAARTGKSILMIFANENNKEFADYKANVLPELQRRYGDQVVMVRADTATKEGQELARTNYAVNQEAYTLLKSVKQNGDKLETEDVDGSRFVGSSAQFIPDHIGQYLPVAFNNMAKNGFPRKA